MYVFNKWYRHKNIETSSDENIFLSRFIYLSKI